MKDLNDIHLNKQQRQLLKRATSLAGKTDSSRVFVAELQRYKEFDQMYFNDMEFQGEQLPLKIVELEVTAEDAYSDLQLALHSRFDNAPSIDEAIKAVEKINLLFDEIIIEALQESELLARTLSLEPISRPLLKSYLYEIHHRPKLRELLTKELPTDQSQKPISKT